jgi:hypothetical protein
MPAAVWMQATTVRKVKLATAWREANCSRDNKNITASTAEGRLITTTMPEKKHQQERQQHNMDANST